MNDNDIIKALECCSKGDFRNCQECKYLYAEVEETENCNDVLAKDALGIITRLKSEIDKQYEQAESDILGNIADGGIACHWCIDENRKAAIKEFAERLKNEIDIRPTHSKEQNECVFFLIDELVKEMVGD